MLINSLTNFTLIAVNIPSCKRQNFRRRLASARPADWLKLFLFAAFATAGSRRSVDEWTRRLVPAAGGSGAP